MLASSVAILTLVAPVQASCFTYNYGATYREDVGGATYSGVKAYEDFQSADVPQTYLVAHPIQVDTASGDFVGWGTYQGYGTDDPVENCPDDYNAHWKIYVDGVSHGVQFCDAWLRFLIVYGLRSAIQRQLW